MPKRGRSLPERGRGSTTCKRTRIEHADLQSIAFGEQKKGKKASSRKRGVDHIVYKKGQALQPVRSARKEKTLSIQRKKKGRFSSKGKKGAARLSSKDRSIKGEKGVASLTEGRS